MPPNKELKLTKPSKMELRSLTPVFDRLHEGAMGYRVRVSAMAVLFSLAMLSGGCIGACDMYSEVKPLGRAFEIRRADMDYLLRRSDAPEYQRFVTGFHMIGVSDRLVVVFDRDPRACPEPERGQMCGRWWIGDLASGETQGPLTAEAFRELKQTNPEVGIVRVGDIEDLWSKL